MGCKHQNLLYDVKGRKQCSAETIIEKMSKTQVNLKIISDIDGSQAICQLIGYNLTDIQVKGGWSGPSRLQPHAHVNVPVADLPVRKVQDAMYFIADLTLHYGRVLHDYNARR
jgi:acetoacetate decarboxylase